MSTSTTSALAAGLAALGAVSFGLAAVRQHTALRTVGRDRGDDRRTRRPDRPAGRRASSVRAIPAIANGLALLRQREWLLGAAQAGLGGALHVVALTLAPITLVQPIGVLAVPVTVVRAALGQHRWPSRGQVTGSLLSVGGVAALTLVLLPPAGHVVGLPTATAVALAAGSATGTGAALALAGRHAPAAVRCVARAVVAAGLFGLGSVLVRTLGLVVTGGSPHPVGLGVTALLGLVVVLPLGVWSMQSAYVVGSPQVVICCLTLVDPVAAVVGGRLLLGDGSGVTASTLPLALGCGLAAAAGVVLLARDHRVDDPPATGGDQQPRGSSMVVPTARVRAPRPAEDERGLLTNAR